MEGLVRLVAESLERHGLTVPAPRIDWSPWTPVDPNLCLTAPCHPGLFVIAEQMVPHTMSANSATQLVILKVGQTQDLGIEMARLCYHSSLYDRINAGRCLVRFAVVDNDAQRASAWSGLLSNTLETSIRSQFAADLTTDFLTADVVTAAGPVARQIPLINDVPTKDMQAEPVLANSARQTTPSHHAAPLPSGL